ncbi:MAG: hypothetical protein ACOC45_00400 [Alkalispirochaetaceae bacterium]
MENRWYRLDNAAKLFPAVESPRITTLFRVSATLAEPVEPELLQRALEASIDRFPYFRVRLRRGFFWYYLEHNPQIPQVRGDSLYPCQRLHRRHNRQFLFRLRYYENRVALELSHVLSDGTGATVFLRTILATYYSLQGVTIPAEKGVLDIRGVPREEEGEDAYSQFHTEDLPPPPKSSGAYHPGGALISPGRYYLTTAVIPSAEVVGKAKGWGVSVTEYLCAVYTWALQETQGEERREKRFRPIRISVPVNLRGILSKEPLRNFSLFLTPGIDPRLGRYDLEEILRQVHHAMRLDLNEKSIRQQISRNVGGERHPLIRALPLALKKLFAPIIYRAMGENLYSGSLSNLGVITMPDELAARVRRFEFIPGPGPINKTRATAVSFDGTLYLSFGRLIEGTRVERHFFRKLREEGISVYLESNIEEAVLCAQQKPNRCPECDVELRPTLSRCPICLAEPVALEEREAMRPLYPQEATRDLPEATEGRRREPHGSPMTVLATSAVLLLPGVITLLVDLWRGAGMSWSFFTLSSLALLWVFLVPPQFVGPPRRLAKLFGIDAFAVAIYLGLFDWYTGGGGWGWYSLGGVLLFWIYGGVPYLLPETNRIESALAVDLSATAGYLYLLEQTTTGGHWFEELAVPLLFYLAVASYGALLPIRRRWVVGVDRVAAVFYALGLLSLGVDRSVRSYLGREGLSLWSLIVLVSVLVLAVVCHTVEHNRRLNAFARRRLHL